jgi:hypothetical protein
VSFSQRYVYEADEDKQRYIRELQAYQSSEAYRAFLRRRAAHRALCGEWGTRAWDSRGVSASSASPQAGWPLMDRPLL